MIYHRKERSARTLFGKQARTGGDVRNFARRLSLFHPGHGNDRRKQDPFQPDIVRFLDAEPFVW